LCHPFGADNIFGLRGLVATTQQDEHDTLTAREIHAIASSDINSHFAHPAANGSNITQIAEAGLFQAGKDAGFGAHVAKLQQPFLEDLGLSKLVHQRIVSIWIRRVKLTAVLWCALTRPS
jgi:hypothetical protein